MTFLGKSSSSSLEKFEGTLQSIKIFKTEQMEVSNDPLLTNMLLTYSVSVSFKTISSIIVNCCIIATAMTLSLTLFHHINDMAMCILKNKQFNRILIQSHFLLLKNNFQFIS